MGSTAIVALVECDGPPETSTPLRVSRWKKSEKRFWSSKSGKMPI